MYSISVNKDQVFLKKYFIGSKRELSIGRHPSNDIYLPDPSCKVSRFHIALFYNPIEEVYYFQDLGSKNNTFINGKKNDYGYLYENDKIVLGNYELIIYKDEIENKGNNKEKIVLIKENIDVKTVFSSISFEKNQVNKLKENPERLLILYELNNCLIQNYDLTTSLQKITEKLFDLISPDRILLTLFEKDTNQISCLSKFPCDAENNISNTVLEYLLKEKQTLITENVQKDIRFKAAASVQQLSTQSIISVPIIWDNELRGIIYIDSFNRNISLTDENLITLSIIADDLSVFLKKELDYCDLKEENVRFEHKLLFDNLVIGCSDEIRRTLETVNSISSTDAAVLLTGETGTGKDLFAKVIHENSKRKSKPFIEINIPEISENLFESELFGHKKGAFTHAYADKKGRFRLADGGTVFLNEIGELPLTLQAKLLKVIEQKSVWPVGEDKPYNVDVRIIAATNQDLGKKVSEGSFRQDLYQRLKVFPIHIPPLRERKLDIPLLVGYFIYKARLQGNRITKATNLCIDHLLTYDWPGNIRELKYSIERATYLTKNSLMTPDLFDFSNKLPKTLKEIEKDHIINVLEFTKGNKEKAIKILGISKQTLYNKCKEYSLEVTLDI